MQHPNPIERVPPNSRDAEMAVLGAMLLSPEVAAVSVLNQLTDAQFYHAAHQVIFREIAAMMASMRTFDLITLTQRLTDKKLLEDIGGPVYLSDLISSVPTTTNVEYYIDIVREKHLLRQVIGAAYEIMTSAYEPPEDVRGWLHQVEQRIFDLTTVKASQDVKPLRVALDEAIADIDRMLTSDRNLVGLSTGFTELDAITTGFNAPDVWIIAARPSVGKTGMMVNLVENVASRENVPVGVFSLESNMKSLARRMIARGAEVNLRRVRHLSDKQKKLIADSHVRLSKLEVWYDERGGLTINEIRAQARRMVGLHGCRILFIDYLQLAGAEGRSASKWEAIAQVSNGLKSIAKELNVPLVVLSQLSRRAEQQSRDPMLSDLAESDAIGRDADVVIFLNDGLTVDNLPQEYQSQVNDKDMGQIIRVDIKKQREGPQAEMYLRFTRNFMRFEDITWGH